MPASELRLQAVTHDSNHLAFLTSRSNSMRPAIGRPPRPTADGGCCCRSSRPSAFDHKIGHESSETRREKSTPRPVSFTVRYMQMPEVLGNAYSRAIDVSWPDSYNRKRLHIMSEFASVA